MFGKILASAVFCLLFLGTAYAQPGIPHQFYGSVTVNGALAKGIPIVAKISGTEISTTSSNGTYGYDPCIFYVPDPNNTLSGPIDFYLSGTKVASHSFETGGYTRLDLSIGTAPTSTPPSGAPLSTGGGPSGGSTNRLDVEIEGSCVGEEIVVTVLNTVGNPARGADVKAVKDRKTVEQQDSDDEGKVSFTFSEAGEYYIYVTKTNYSQTTKKVEVKECIGGQEETPGEEGEEAGTESLCDNVDCDDSNPCTTEYCATKTGHCVYENQADSLSCGGKNTCQAGVCVEPTAEEEEKPTGTPTSTGFVGLGQASGAGLIIIALIGLVLLVAGKKRKKK